MKKDPYQHKENYERWIKAVAGKKNVYGMNERNSALFMIFLKDLQIGLNVSKSSKRGERSYIRLNTIRGKLAFVINKLEERGIEDITTATARDLHTLFSDMRSGVIHTRYGLPYKSTGDYVKDFKTFWHWYQKVQKQNGVSIEDVTDDLDARGSKPKFVYFTKEDFEQILEQASFDLKPLVVLAFDSGMRVTELLNIKISDFQDGYRELVIRDETSKTFGRRIKLMLCPEQIKNYIRCIHLQKDDYLSDLKPVSINKELREIGKKVLSAEQIKYKNLTLKDFRHSSACFWLPRYKSESALKYRFGWKKSDMIHYYTEFLGMKDTINQDDMYVDITKTELEKEVERLNNDIQVLKDSIRELIAAATKKNIIADY